MYVRMYIYIGVPKHTSCHKATLAMTEMAQCIKSINIYNMHIICAYHCNY